MPWSPKQHRLFEAAAHSPEVAARTGIKQSDAVRMASEGIKPESRRTRLAGALSKMRSAGRT